MIRDVAINNASSSLLSAIGANTAHSCCAFGSKETVEAVRIFMVTSRTLGLSHLFALRASKARNDGCFLIALLTRTVVVKMVSTRPENLLVLGPPLACSWPTPSHTVCGRSCGRWCRPSCGRKSLPECSLWAAAARRVRIPPRIADHLLCKDATGFRTLSLSTLRPTFSAQPNVVFGLG